MAAECAGTGLTGLMFHDKLYGITKCDKYDNNSQQ